MLRFWVRAREPAAGAGSGKTSMRRCELPIVYHELRCQPTKFELVFDLEAASALELDAPYLLFVTANQVIE